MRGQQLRSSRALRVGTFLVVWGCCLADARAQAFDDFPDDAGGSSSTAAPPTRPSPSGSPPSSTTRRGREPSAPAEPARSPERSEERDRPATPDDFADDFADGPPTPPRQQGRARPSATDGSAPVRPPARGAGLDPSTHDVRLRELEQRIHELRERIFRSKARLALLGETVLEGLSAGAHARIVHEDAMGGSYRLVRATYAIDGAPVFNREADDGTLGEVETFDVFDGTLAPGEHTLTVSLEYRGHGFGAFTYLRGYRFRTHASYVFNVPDGRSARIRVTGFEDGGPNTPLEDRPAIRFGQRVVPMGEDASRRRTERTRGEEGRRE